MCRTTLMLQMFKSLTTVLRRVSNATPNAHNGIALRANRSYLAIKVVSAQSKLQKSPYCTVEAVNQRRTEVIHLDEVIRPTKEQVKKNKRTFYHPYLATLAKSVPFVRFNKDRVTRRNFEWQNKFVASTTGPLVANLNRMWRLFRQQTIRHQDWSLFHVTGGPGVGKSRYGAEMLHSLKTSDGVTIDPVLYSLITEAADKGHYAFVNMSILSGNFIREGESIPKLIIAKLLDLEPNSILGTVKISDLAKFLSRVLRPATYRNPLLLQVHIDEIQACLSPQDLWKSGSLLHKIISEFMKVSFQLAKHHIFMIVVTSGSLDLSMKETYSSWGFPIQKLVLEPISDEDAIELLATRRKFVPQNRAFQRLVKAQGGLLRLLDRLDELLAKYPNDASLQDNLRSIWERQLQIATSLYPPPPEEILQLALVGKQLDENTLIYRSPFYAFEINESFYRQVTSIDKFKLFYPFILICAWSRLYDIPPMSIFRAPTLPMTISNANFKRFSAWYSVLLEKRNEPSFYKNLPREEVLKYLSPSLSYLREVDVTPNEEVGVTVVSKL